MSTTRSGRGGAVSSWVLLGLAAAYFLLPLLALARFSFQRVPVALLGWSNLFDNWTWDGLLDALRDPGFGAGAVAERAPRHRRHRPHPRPAAAHRAVGAPARPVGPGARRGAVRPAVRRAADRPGRRRDRSVPRPRAVVHPQRPQPDPLLHPARHAVHLPGARRRDHGDRPAHARRRVALPRCRVDDDAVPGARAQPGQRFDLVGVPHRDGGARRVHDRQPAAQGDVARLRPAARRSARCRAASPSACCCS